MPEWQSQNNQEMEIISSRKFFEIQDRIIDLKRTKNKEFIDNFNKAAISAAEKLKDFFEVEFLYDDISEFLSFLNIVANDYTAEEKYHERGGTSGGIVIVYKFTPKKQTETHSTEQGKTSTLVKRIDHKEDESKKLIYTLGYLNWKNIS